MFTGLVQALGRVAAVDQTENGARLAIEAPGLAAEISEGDSVAVNGVCLTATRIEDGRFHADVMRQTLMHTSLGRLRGASEVNLELPLRAHDRMGGHVVQGHVDGIGEVVDVTQDGFARKLAVRVEDAGLLRYVVDKGSIAIDGVSLTVAAVDERHITVSLIPETLERTNLGSAAPGSVVNLEVDVLAKYVEKLVMR